MIEPLIVSLGNRLYEVNRPWAADHIQTGRGHVSDVATDSRNRLYAFNRFDRYTDPAVDMVEIGADGASLMTQYPRSIGELCA